ncbi:hypothetical protein WJ438_08485 [Streptomyces sp. GD-15H]
MPGDTVDHEVVGDQQQPSGSLVSGVEPHRPQHHAVVRGEFGDGGVGPLVEQLRREAGGRVRDSDAPQSVPCLDRARRGHLEGPTTVSGGHGTRPQGVVALQQCLQGRGEVLLPQTGGDLDEGGLVVAVHAAAAAGEPVDDRGGDERADGLVPHRLGGRRAGGRDGRQGGRGAVLEDVAGGQPQSGTASEGDHLEGDDRVAAQVEEVVVRADGGYTERLGEDGAERLLRRGGRGTAGGGGDHRGSGQRLPVELAVGGQRQGVERDERGGHHVVGQQRGQVVPERGLIAVPAVGHDGVAHQFSVTGPVLPDDDGRLDDVLVGLEAGLDLAEFDAEAADLDLVVGAAEVLQLPVVVPACQVAGAVHPAAGRAVRVGDEALGGQGVPAQVAVGQARAGHVHLTDDTRRGGSEGGVQHPYPEVGDAPADEAARGGLGGQLVQCAVGDVDGGLGDAVHVDQAGGVVGVAVVPLLKAPEVERLAAEDHVAQGQACAQVGVVGVGAHQLVEGGGRLVEDGDLLVGQQGQEVLR